MSRLMALVVMALVVAACSSPQLADDPPGSEVPSSVAPTVDPTPEATPTEEPTPSPSPVPEAELVRAHQVVYAWGNDFSDFINYQVILAVTNEGGGWAEVSAFDSDYQVLDGAGGLVSTGSFTYVYPEVVGPGETAYLIADSVEQNVDPASFVTVEADARFNLVESAEVTFTFEEVQLVKGDFEPGYTASGFVTASADVTDAAVAVVCLDAAGKPLGATWTNLVQNLGAGARKGFETVGASPPLDPAQCAALSGFAQDTGF